VITDDDGEAPHVQSTMRMGESESDSVLDANAESRAVEGLFIADNSDLANGIGGPNPTLTTQALATRTRREDLQRLFRRLALGHRRAAGGLHGARGHSRGAGARALISG